MEEKKEMGNKRVTIFVNAGFQWLQYWETKLEVGVTNIDILQNL